MRIGIDVSQHRLSWDELLDRVRFAEDAGFDGAWVFDHFMALYGEGPGPCMEAWTLLAALAAGTTRIRLGALVTGVTYRHPSILAAEAVTVDHVSGGRLEFGLGAAWCEEEHFSLGIDFPPTPERVERLEEALDVVRLLMTTDGASFAGRHYRLDDATYLPRPVQQPHPPIWIGASAPKRMLPLAGRKADVWHNSGTPEETAWKWDVVREHAERAGRDPSRITRAANLSLSEPWDEVRRTADAYRQQGVSYVICSWPAEGRQRVDQFIQQVMPGLVTA